MAAPRPFLSAEWRNLLILNYEVEPDILAPLVPAGTLLDSWQGKTLVSMVGFQFLKTRLLGIPVPLHRNFLEVNLRFYVLRETPEGPRRGVAFVKEIVPLPAVAAVARWVYRENYVAMRMGATIERERKTGQLRKNGLVEYTWRANGRLNRLGGLIVGDPQPLTPGSEAEFITEHYWGYTRLSSNRTGEYQVEHPAWRVWAVEQPYFLSNVKDLYGEAFEPFLRHRPCSAFLAEGSPVQVRIGRRFRSKK